MCVCKETDLSDSSNDSTLVDGEGQGSRGETFHPFYRESPVSSVAEHPLFLMNTVLTEPGHTVCVYIYCRVFQWL
jgi:hypothetical protein